MKGPDIPGMNGNQGNKTSRGLPERKEQRQSGVGLKAVSTRKRYLSG